MLVPLFEITLADVPASAALIDSPGAAKSGFSRRSLVGPWDESVATLNGIAAAIEATVTTVLAVPGMLSVIFFG